MLKTAKNAGKCVRIHELTKRTSAYRIFQYYEAVGPMPPRLQAPLWRSPTSSPQHQRHVHYHHHHRTEPASAAASGRRGNGKVETTRTRNDEDYDAELDAAYFAHQDETRRGKACALLNNPIDTSDVPCSR